MIALVVSVTACGGPFAAPTTRDECYAAGREQRGGHSADASSMWTMTYSQDSHALGSTATIYLCVPDDVPATVETRVEDGELAATGSVAEAEGVVVDPATLVLTEGSSRGVPTLEVTVTGGDAHSLVVSYGSEGGGGTSHVDIDVDGGEWSFAGR